METQELRVKLYVSGPMRGYPEFNFPAFQTATESLREQGFEVRSPAEEDLKGGFDPNGTLEGQEFNMAAAFTRDFHDVMWADGIVLLRGWMESKGATAEFLVAHLTGKSIYLLGYDNRTLHNITGLIEPEVIVGPPSYQPGAPAPEDAERE